MVAENAVDHRYVSRLLIEMLSYLPASERPAPGVVTLEYRRPPTPAQVLRQQAEELWRQADRLERAGQLRREVEQAVAWLDGAGAGVSEIVAEAPAQPGVEAVTAEPTAGPPPTPAREEEKVIGVTEGYYCRYCKKWIAGEPKRYRVDDMGILSGRRGTVTECRECDGEISFFGMRA